MKKVLISACYVVFLLSSCTKSNDNRNCAAVNIVAPANETAALKAYIESNHIDAVADSRGFYYKILEPGTGSRPTVCSGIVVPWDLSSLIIGWQEGIPLIAKGGSIILYLPPSLGYGSAAAGPIPANSILVFTITLSGMY
jgi:hypothetical protein